MKTPKPSHHQEFQEWVKREVLSVWQARYDPKLLRPMEKEQIIEAMKLNNPKALPRSFRSSWKYYLQKRRMENEGAQNKNEIKVGPNGGTYTEDVTKDGRPYRRYF